MCHNLWPHEVISVHIGQAGVQIGNACWELYTIEHGLSPDGRLENALDVHNIEGFSTFFSETSLGKHVPHSLYIDLKPNIVDEVHTGKYCSLFHLETMITSKEDAVSNYTQGHYMIGKEQIDNVMDRVQHLADNCTALPSSPLPTNMDTNLTCPQQGHEKLQHCDSAVCCMSAHIAGLGGIYRSREMCMTWRVLPVAATLTMLVFGTLFLINKD